MFEVACFLDFVNTFCWIGDGESSSLGIEVAVIIDSFDAFVSSPSPLSFRSSFAMPPASLNSI